MRTAAKVDANQAKIVKALRAAGASVAVTSSVGKGFPDICVGYRGRTYLLEIKDGSLPPSRRRLTVDELRFFIGWYGHYAVVDDETQALREIGAIG